MGLLQGLIQTDPKFIRMRETAAMTHCQAKEPHQPHKR